MDIHRCRFVPYRPQSINSLAFSHQSKPNQKPSEDLRLALGRENGDIEIYNPLGGRWVQEKILRGSRDRTIEQLTWTQDLIVDEDELSNQVEDGPLRLFSSGGSSSITEWDLATGQHKRHAEGNVGDIWCFAAQPQWKRGAKDTELSKLASAPSQLLAAGCSDGSTILFSTEDDSLQFLRVLSPAASKRGKVISITWRDRDTVVAGYEDGKIQVFNVPTRSNVRTMSLGKGPDNSSSVVWTINCLPDGTILSGDSSGELKIWDAKTLSLTQRLKGHDADILSIATSADGNTIFTAGIDRRVCVYKRISTGGKSGKWQKLSHRRFHEHDVKALASFEAQGISVVVSGGIDTVPIVMPLRNWGSENQLTLSHLPQQQQLSCSSKSRLMVTWWERDLFIWNLPERQDFLSEERLDEPNVNHQLLARIELKGDEHITSAQISENGEMIVAATGAGTKLFQVRKRLSADEVDVRTRPIDLPPSIRSFGAVSVGFSPDNKWLYAVRTNNVVAMVKIVRGATSKDRLQLYPQVIKLAKRYQTQDQSQPSRLGKYLQSIRCVAFSSDSRVLAAGDLSGAIDTWVLEGHEDLQEVSHDNDTASNSSDSDSDTDSEDETDSRVIQGQKWIRNPSGSTLPRLDSAILGLTFRPHSTSSYSSDSNLGLHATRHNPHPVSHELPPSDTKLVAVTASHRIMEFDVMSGRLSDWSRRNASSNLPQSFTQVKDRIMGVFWDCVSSAKQERLWLYGTNWLFMLDMTRDLNLLYAQDKIGQIGDYEVRDPLASSTIVKRTAGDTALSVAQKKRKRNTGAGDKKRPEEYLIAAEISTQPESMDVDTGLLSPVSDDEDNDEDVEMENTDTLAQLRRGVDTTRTSTQEAIEQSASSAQSNISLTPSSPSHHIIFRYRSIFGIAALQPQHPSSPPSDPATDQIDFIQTKPTKASNLEIVLVERPMYDVDLLPRFDTAQDWAT